MFLGTAIAILRKRARDNRLTLAVAFITVLLASTLMAAAPLYSAAVSLAGVRESLRSAPPGDVTITVSTSSNGSNYVELDQRVTRELQFALGPDGGTVDRLSTSESYAFAGQTNHHTLVVFHSADTISSYATLVAGTWPAFTPGLVDTAVPSSVASQLGIKVGDELQLINPIDDVSIKARITGIYQPDRVDDPYWRGDALAIEGKVQQGSFTTYGPFIVARQTFVSVLSTRPVSVSWYAVPDVNQLTVGDLPGLRARVAGIPAALGTRNDDSSTMRVTTGLPALIRDNEQRLLATRATVLSISAQLGLLALYALVLTAGLLADQRSAEIALLRARGAGVRHIALLSIVEGITLIVPATAVAPLLAALILRGLNRAGPLAGTGLRIDPSVSLQAYLLAGIAGIACLLALVLPSILVARSILEIRAERGRSRRRNVILRAGLDVALFAIAAIAYLQLRHYHQPVTTTTGGVRRIDPLLVAVPGLVLAAGAVLGLRLLPLFGRSVERMARRSARLVPALGAWSVARRPSRLGRMTLLLVLTLGIGLFAAIYSATWSTSQEDQARFEVGADLHLNRDQRPDALPGLFLASAYDSLGGVRASMPVEQRSEQLAGGTGTIDTILLDSARAPDIVHVRGDLADPDFATLMGKLAAARPATGQVQLPGTPARVALDLWWTMQQLCQRDSGGPSATSTSGMTIGCRDVQSDWNGKVQEWSAPVTPSLVLRDASGQLFRLTGTPLPSTDADHPGATRRVIFSLRYALQGGADLTPQYPVSIAAIELDVLAPSFAAREGQFEVRSIQLSDESSGEHWTPLPAKSISNVSAWTTATTAFDPQAGVSPEAAVETSTDDMVVRLKFTSGSTNDLTALPATISLQPAGSARPVAIPAIANSALMNKDALHLGDTLRMSLGGRDREVVLVGSMDAFPTTDAADPALILDLQTLEALELVEPGNRMDEPSQQWLAVSPGAADRLAGLLVAQPFRSSHLVSEAERARSLRTDPVVLGTIGALSSGFVAAAVFAITGFLLNMVVTARERRTELALLRALGLSTRQLGGWLLLEQGLLVVCGLVLGAGLGLFLAWLVLPLIALSRAATLAFPPPVIVVPWGQITLLQASLVALLALTGGATSMLLRRQGLGQSLRMGEE